MRVYIIYLLLYIIIHYLFILPWQSIQERGVCAFQFLGNLKSPFLPDELQEKKTKGW